MNVRGREGNCARIENAVTFHLQGDRPGNKKKKIYRMLSKGQGKRSRGSGSSCFDVGRCPRFKDALDHSPPDLAGAISGHTFIGSWKTTTKGYALAWLPRRYDHPVYSISLRSWRLRYRQPIHDIFCGKFDFPASRSPSFSRTDLFLYFLSKHVKRRIYCLILSLWKLK